MNILIVEDDHIQSENLMQMIQGIDDNFEIYIAEDKDEAFKILTEHIIDIFYIDIFLKNSSGLDLAIDFRKIHKYELSWVIFLTTHVEYITQAFKEVHCYDYILKPYDKNELIDISKRILSCQVRNIVVERKHIVLNLKNNILIKIYIDEIIFIEVNVRTCFIHTKRGSYEVKRLSLKECLKLTNSKNIIQCHKSFAVNINYIIKIKKLSVKSYEIFFEDYNEKAILSYKFKDAIIENFKNNQLDIALDERVRCDNIGYN